jgi:hypothetical protein
MNFVSILSDLKDHEVFHFWENATGKESFGEKLKAALNIPEAEDVIGYFDADFKPTDDVIQALAICSTGIYWSSNHAMYDDDEKRGRQGSIKFEDLANFSVSIKPDENSIVFYPNDVKAFEFVVLEIKLSKKLKTGDEKKNKELQTLIKNTLTRLIDACIGEYGKKSVHDESLNVDEIKAFLGEGDPDNAAYAAYTKFFAKNSINGVDKFSVSWSYFIKTWRDAGLAGIIPAVFTLFYRKCYLPGFLSIVGFFVVYILIGDPNLWFIPLLLLLLFYSLFTPYFVFRKFRSIQRKTKHITDNEKRLETISTLGGVNYLFVFIGLALFIGAIVSMCRAL